MQLARTKIRNLCKVHRRVHTITAPDTLLTAAAKRYVLNVVRITIIKSNANGMENIPRGLKDASTGRHTPESASYTKFSADPLETTYRGFQRKKLTVE